MARIVLSLYLTLAAAAGPWLCCCTPEALARTFAPAPSSPPADLTPAEQQCCCCPPSQSEDETPPLQPAPTERHPCACHEPQPPALTATAVSGADLHLDSAFAWLQFDLGLTSATVSGVGTPSPASLDATNLPFLASSDILRAFHILRC